MFKFLVALLIYGEGDITDNTRVYLGKHPATQEVAPVVAVEYHVRF